MSNGVRSREVRLGLVMYGGVSLAIYINGVAHELFRAVRGRGTYRLLKALTDSDVVVDVLSGSSAGGINGILLAYALCNECEFKTSAELWRKRGDIGELLRGVDEAPSAYQSLLDSEGKYEPWLLEAFEELARNPITEATKEAPSAFDELDLFVTGTDFHGRKWSTSDDRGREIQIKDHRALFWLKHRKGRKEPFSPGAGPNDEPGAQQATTHPSLARLARITSCFPGAFAPVTVGAIGAIDRRLRRWGALSGTDARVYIDGGVLDNKPFTTTLEAIYSRLANRSVCRWMLYVEPDPERFEQDPEVPASPSVVKTALDSLTALPAYESIADDLRGLQRHNEKVERMSALRDQLISAAREGMGDENLYRRARILSLGEHVLASFFTRELERSDADRCSRSAQRVLRESFQQHIVDGGDDVVTRYLELDIDFRIRRLLYLTYAFEGELLEDQREGRSNTLLSVLNRQLEFLQIVRSAMEGAVERVAERVLREGQSRPGVHYDADWAQHALREAHTALRRIAMAEGAASHARVSAVIDLDTLLSRSELSALALRLRGPAAEAGDAQAALTGTLALFSASDRFERELFARKPELAKAYEDFQNVDRVVFPIELISGLRGYDMVRIARVSPRDACTGLADRPMDQKVTGQRFAHFAAFFKRSWRSNDILWGRIDGACELVDVLLDEKRLRELFTEEHLSAPGARARQTRVIEGLAALIGQLESDPEALPLALRERNELFAWLRRLCSDQADVRKAAIAQLGQRVDGPRQWLVEAAQLEAVGEDLRAVFSDAAAEQLEWNQYGANLRDPAAAAAQTARADALSWSLAHGPWIPGEGSLDRGVIAATTAVVAQRAVLGLLKDPPSLKHFFRKDYRVGEETLADIPPIVILDWFARGLIVAQKSLLASLGDRAELVRTHPAYQAFFGWPLRALAGTVNMLRRAPRWIAASTVGAILYIALSVLVLVFWRKPVVVNDQGLAMPGAALFLALPILLVLFLRITVAVRVGASVPVWIVRVVGWLIASVLAVASFPVLSWLLTDPAQDEFARHFEPLCRVSGGFVSAGACGEWTGNLASVGRYLVTIAALVGFLAVSGGFGIFVRWLGRASRALSRARKGRSPLA